MLTYTSVVVLVVVEEYLCGTIKTEVAHAPGSHLKQNGFLAAAEM